jgi:hypothetical protein
MKYLKQSWLHFPDWSLLFQISISTTVEMWLQRHCLRKRILLILIAIAIFCIILVQPMPKKNYPLSTSNLLKHENESGPAADLISHELIVNMVADSNGYQKKLEWSYHFTDKPCRQNVHEIRKWNFSRTRIMNMKKSWRQYLGKLSFLSKAKFEGRGIILI